MGTKELTMETQKATYWKKKDALSVLNSARININRKKLPVRVYTSNNVWHITSRPNERVGTIFDDIDNIVNYWSCIKNQSNLSKQEKERTHRLISRLKQISCI